MHATSAVPDLVIQSEEGRSYNSFVSELMHRVSKSLELQVHGTSVGNETSAGVAGLHRAMEANPQAPETGKQILNMRFALGADDTAYLNSAISTLFTGTEMDNAPIDVTGLYPPDLTKQVRKAVINQLQSERRKRRKDAIRVLNALSSQIIFYLSFPRVRECVLRAMEILFPEYSDATNAGFDVNDQPVLDVVLNITGGQYSPENAVKHFKIRAGGKAVYALLLVLEAALDNSGCVGTVISKVIEDMVGHDAEDAYLDPNDAHERANGNVRGETNSERMSLYQRLDARYKENIKEYTEGGLKDSFPGAHVQDAHNLLSEVQDRVNAPERREIGEEGSYTQYCIRRGLVGLRGPLHTRDITGIGSSNIVNFQEFVLVDQQLAYSTPQAQMQKLAPHYDPNSRANDVWRTYRQTKLHFKSIVHNVKLTELEEYANEAWSDMRYNYAYIPHNIADESIEARFAIQWKPREEVGENISKAASMEHAASMCYKHKHNKNYTAEPMLEAVYSIMAAGFELRRVAPHAAVVDHSRKSGTPGTQHSYYDTASGAVIQSVAPPNLCTTPHAEWGTTDFAVPYESGYAELRIDDEDTDVVSDESQYNNAIVGDNTPFDYESRLLGFQLQGGEGVDDAYLPDMYFGPPSDYQFFVNGARQPPNTQEYPTFQYRSGIRDVRDDDHKRLLPDGNSELCLKQLRRPCMHSIVRYALLHSHALHEEVCVDSVGDATAQATLLQATTTTQKDSRAGIWNDMLREISISNDRLYTFVRTLSGAMGEDASVLLSSVDETAQRAARAMESERKEIAKRVSDFQSKIVEIIISGIVKTSRLEMRPDGSDGNFEVVDAEMANQLRALASGESGRPFYEANVAVQAMISQSRTDRTSLGAVVKGLSSVVSTLNEQLQTELLNSNSAGSGGLSMIAQPRNSFMVHLRDDATAAIRVAYDRFSNEFRGRMIRLYELVEGCDPHLSLRFAEFVANVLIQIRTSSGQTALYVSEGIRQQTALQARASLVRLTNRASVYVRSSPMPNFNNGSSASSIQAARMSYFSNAVAQNGSAIEKGYIVRVEGRSDTLGGWNGGYHLPYNVGLRYAPYPSPRSLHR
jgi:hypothetical protein